MANEPQIDPLIEKLFEKTDKPAAQVLEKLSNKIKFIKDTIKDFPTEALIEDIVKRCPKSRESALAAIFLAVDWESLPAEQTKSYLLNHILTEASSLDTTITGKLRQHKSTAIQHDGHYILIVNDIGIFPKDLTLVDVDSYTPYKSTIGSFIEHTFYPRILESRCKDVIENKKLNTTAVKDTPEVLSTKGDENPLFVIAEDGVVSDDSCKDFNYVPRGDVRKYLLAFNKHIWRIRGNERTRIILNRIVDDGTVDISTPAKDENDRVIKQLSKDFNAPNLSELFLTGPTSQKFENGLGRLIMSYVLLDELQQGLNNTDPINSMETFTESWAREDQADKAMGLLFVIDKGLANSNQRYKFEAAADAAKYSLISPRFPIQSELEGSLAFFRTGHSSNQVTTKEITFDKISELTRKLIVASFMGSSEEQAQAEEDMHLGVEKLRKQLGDYTSEKYRLTAGSIRLPSCTGTIVEIANLFLSKKIEIPERNEMSTLPHLGFALHFFDNLKSSALATSNLLVESVAGLFKRKEITLEEGPTHTLQNETNLPERIEIRT